MPKYLFFVSKYHENANLLSKSTAHDHFFFEKLRSMDIWLFTRYSTLLTCLLILFPSRVLSSLYRQGRCTPCRPAPSFFPGWLRYPHSLRGTTLHTHHNISWTCPRGNIKPPLDAMGQPTVMFIQFLPHKMKLISAVGHLSIVHLHWIVYYFVHCKRFQTAPLKIQEALIVS